MIVQRTFPTTATTYFPSTITVSKICPSRLTCDLAKGRLDGCTTCPIAARCLRRKAGGMSFGEVLETKRGHLNIRA